MTTLKTKHLNITKSIISIFVLVLALLTISSCDEDKDEDACPDCLEQTHKTITYLDSNGNNLLFGSTAIYNPEDISITTDNGQSIEFSIDQTNETISFAIEVFNTYEISLSSIFVDVFEFELAERKSEVCCGNVIFSTETMLNGEEIENNDLITITRD